MSSQQRPDREAIQPLLPPRASTSDRLHRTYASSKATSDDCVRNEFNPQRKGYGVVKKAAGPTTHVTKNDLKAAENLFEEEVQECMSSICASRENIETLGRIKRSGSSPKNSQRVFYNDMIMERILHGDEKSLKELGRELLMKQLENYRRKHSR
ncbi:unnamed protein product [Phytomonas sp. Hart1]|nr:unnamed protein product [Phytomonas sp. Hart1]|eukprot:CCW71117.1 unnamed protein product [Phytomonas sp. isolate Hart1]